MLKESKVAVISAILEDFCKRIQGRRYLSNPGGFVLKESRSPLSQQSWRICVKGIQGRRYLSNPGQAGVSLSI